MAEDILYRQSSQYKSWSFTSSKLASLRQHSNARGIKRIKSTWSKARIAVAAQGVNTDDIPDPECLTVEEELVLIRFYVQRLTEMSDVFKFPSNVMATAVTYLHRFHLHHSPHLHHPKSHLPTILFLSTKTENYYTPLKDFCAKIPKSTPESVIEHEFLVAGGVGWDLDVRHPFRSLEGGVMDLLTAISNDDPGLQWKAVLAEDKLEAQERIRKAHGRTKEMLKREALWGDVYLLFTPPQIFLGALFTVDSPLAELFIDWTLSRSPPATPLASMREKLLSTIKECASMLIDAKGYATVPIDEVKRIDKKLYRCMHPRKYIKVPDGIGGVTTTIAGKTKAGDEGEEERKAKKRKLERERMEKNGDVFGAAIGGTAKTDGGMFGALLKQE